MGLLLDLCCRLGDLFPIRTKLPTYSLRAKLKGREVWRIDGWMGLLCDLGGKTGQFSFVSILIFFCSRRALLR